MFKFRKKCSEICGILLEKMNNYIVTIYRSLSNCFKTFLGVLKRALNAVNSKNIIIIAGDFNVHYTITIPTRQNHCLHIFFLNIGTEDCTVYVVETNIRDEISRSDIK